MYSIISNIYDSLNKNKNYKNEVMLIVNKYNTYCGYKINRLLDIGCGTGSHLLHFSQFINHGIGIDINEKMIEEAINKKITNVKFITNKIENISESDFDITTLLFQVVNHIHNINELKSLFKCISFKLQTNGLLVFDIFNNDAMCLENPHSEIRYFDNNKLEIDPKFDGNNLTINYKYNYKTKILEYSLNEKIWTCDIISEILSENNIEIIEILENFKNKIATNKSYKILFICRKM